MSESRQVILKRTTICHVCFLAIAIGIALTHSNVQAQTYMVGNGVFGNGGGSIAGGDYMINGTIGQPCIGVVSGTDYEVMSGVLHDVDGVLWTNALENFEQISSLPTTFSLSQNYPNPFNPTTTIAFALPKRSQVNLRLYNILGQTVATLVDKELPAGEYEVTLNGNDLSSGVYFYRITAGDFVQGKKLVLLK